MIESPWQEVSQKFWIRTGKSFSKALFLASTSPQYDKTLSSVHENWKLRTCCVHKLFWMSKSISVLTQHVLPLFWAWNFHALFSCTELVICTMNNLLSYCGLIDAKIRASDKNLPVHSPLFQFSENKCAKLSRFFFLQMALQLGNVATAVGWWFHDKLAGDEGP